MEIDNKIDFVITWVDGNDKEWRKEKELYNPNKQNVSNEEIRFRDWEILKYWFRSIENFAPWVNKIHFVTCGHLPKWLNINNPKLNIVKHVDYMPEEYLPTFSSHPIEHNLFRIKDLSEKFVLFNDDMFILKSVKPCDFFKKNLPCDSFAENTLTILDSKDLFPHILLNNMGVINNNFDKRKVFKKNFLKYINIRYGTKNIRTIVLNIWRHYPAIYDTHIPVSLCKSTLKKVWDKEYEILDSTCKNKFRTINDVNQYIFRFWQMLDGNFYPRSFNFGRYFSLKENNDDIYKAITKPKNKVICINDSDVVEFEKTKQLLQESFEKVLPKKSSFEK